MFQSSLDQWRFVFSITFGVTVLGSIAYSIWASAKIQPFNNPKIAYQNEIAESMERLIQ